MMAMVLIVSAKLRASMVVSKTDRKEEKFTIPDTLGWRFTASAMDVYTGISTSDCGVGTRRTACARRICVWESVVGGRQRSDA